MFSDFGVTAKLQDLRNSYVLYLTASAIYFGVSAIRSNYLLFNNFLFPPSFSRFPQFRRATVTDFPPVVSVSARLSVQSESVTLIRPVHCRRVRRETRSPVSVASRVFSVTGFRPRRSGVLRLTDSTGGKPHHRIRCLSSSTPEACLCSSVSNRRQTSEVWRPPRVLSVDAHSMMPAA